MSGNDEIVRQMRGFDPPDCHDTNHDYRKYGGACAVDHIVCARIACDVVESYVGRCVDRDAVQMHSHKIAWACCVLFSPGEWSYMTPRFNKKISFFFLVQL